MIGIRTALVMMVGLVTGLLGGLFGKGGSAIATPMLSAVGISSFSAVASPLPATIPATLVAAWAYWKAGEIDRAVLRTIIVFGVPTTVLGAVLSGLVGGSALVLACDVIVAGLGVRILQSVHRAAPDRAVPTVAAVTVAARARDFGPQPQDAGRASKQGKAPSARAVATVAVIVGLASGLLANSGGFLLAPLFVTTLGLPLKRALGTSLAAAAVLAIPGTIVHAWMGHIAWSVAIPFGLASVPLSAFGARVALRTDATRLETIYGVALVVLGGGLLLLRV